MLVAAAAAGGDVVTAGATLTGRYLVQRELGTGTVGTLYYGLDLRTRAAVTLRVLHASLARDGTYLARLRLRIQIAASLDDSPYIAPVTELVNDRLRPYLVAAFVPGETLADVLRRDGALTVADTLHVALQVARALDHAGQRGLKHFNLKPSNICIAGGDARLLDVGVVPAYTHTALTGDRVIGAGAEYAAPELNEDAGDIRSDIYSLGVLLYQMLVGRAPFTGDTPAAILRRHAAEPAVLPPGLPAAVYGVAARTLQKLPSQRFQTPAHLVAALEQSIRALDPASARRRLPTAPAPPAVPCHIEPAPAVSEAETAAAPIVATRRPAVHTATAAARPPDAAPAEARTPIGENGSTTADGPATPAPAAPWAGTPPESERERDSPAADTGAAGRSVAVPPSPPEPEQSRTGRAAPPSLTAAETAPDPALPGDNAPATAQPDTAALPAPASPSPEAVRAAFALLGLDPAADAELVELAYHHHLARHRAAGRDAAADQERMETLSRARHLLADPARPPLDERPPPGGPAAPPPPTGWRRRLPFGAGPPAPPPPARSPYRTLRVHPSADRELITIAYRHLLSVAARAGDAALLDELERAYARTLAAGGPAAADGHAHPPDPC